MLNFLFWGLNLIIKKELKRIILKLFLIVGYLVLGTVFIYQTFNNSFWLIDNGNSGFVGEIIYSFLKTWIPWIDSNYSVYGMLLLTITFFSISADINYRSLFVSLFSLFRNKETINSEDDYNYKNINTNEDIIEKPQQSFSFETETAKQAVKTLSRSTFKLPEINYLDKKLNRLTTSEIQKNLPDSSFMEKILLDFGIDGKIKTINNGPVVSLYEFEPAPGVKVSKIINLSEDLARNTSSTSARVSVIQEKIQLALRYRMKKEKRFKRNNF